MNTSNWNEVHISLLTNTFVSLARNMSACVPIISGTWSSEILSSVSYWRPSTGTITSQDGIRVGQQELVINAAWGLKLNPPSEKLGCGCATTEQEQQAAADVAHLDFVMEKS